MRIALDILVVIVLVSVLCGVVIQTRHSAEVSGYPEQTRLAVRQLQQEINLRAALSQATSSTPDFPKTVDPDWFKDNLPRNLVIEGERPWLEVAGDVGQSMDHPPSRTTIDVSTAAFWYNPNLGIIRARVPASLGEKDALLLYNLINETELDSLY